MFTPESEALRKQIYIEDGVFMVNVEYEYPIELARITAMGRKR